MQCPDCQMEAVAGAVFCNHCGTPMPVFCHECSAANPPESRFCHRCGVALSLANDALHPSPPRRREPRIRDIGVDLKTLSVDVAAYSAPRIKQGAIFVGRNTRTFAAYAAPRVKSAAQRLKPYRAEPPALPAMPTDRVADDLVSQERPTSSAVVATVTCPRCHRTVEPGSLFCFSCGLPLDDVQSYLVSRTLNSAGRRAGFWMRLGAWAIDTIILLAVQMIMVGIWPGFSEYFDSNTYLHWVDLLAFILSVLYYTVGVSVWATTVGKRLLGLYVLRPDGAKAGFGRALGRYFAGILSGLIFGIGYLMIGLRSDKRGLHDLICDTVVMRK